MDLDRPVLYLDLDDTLVSWATGAPRAVTGAGEFLAWALGHFEVRWLTTWCPGGEMPEDLLADLVKLLQVPAETVRGIRGLDWSASGCKLDGIAWLEHRVLGRPFAWLEDEKGFGERERSFLEHYGLLSSYHRCNVTRDDRSLARAWRTLRSWHGRETAAA